MARNSVRLARTSGGDHARSPPGEPVSIPLDALRGARGLVTGAPDTDIERAPSVLSERLHAAGQSVLLVDPVEAAGEFAGRHDVTVAGDAAACDKRVSPASAEQVLTVAGEGDASVVLDVETFEADGAEVLARLFDALSRSRRDRRSLVVVLAECHRWLPDAGDSGCAEAVAAVDPENAPGIGVVGVTDRPSTVDAGYRRHCDWILAHRVTWREHVDAVTRILGRGVEDTLESLDDEEALLQAPWLDGLERIRMERSGPSRTGPSPDARKSTASAGEPSHASGSTDSGPDGGATEAAITDLGERIAALETAVEAMRDPTEVVDEVAEAVAARIEPSETREPEASVENLAEEPSPPPTGQSDSAEDSGGGFGAVFDAFTEEDGDVTVEHQSGATEQAPADRSSAEEDPSPEPDTAGGMSFEPASFAFDDGASGGAASPEDIDRSGSRSAHGERRVPRYVRDLVRAVEEMEETTRTMLAHYVDRGADTPLNAHFSAGGSGDRTAAYAHNRQLRTTGFIDHVGRGHYSPAIPEKVRSTADHELSTEEVSRAAEHVRRSLP